MHVLWCCVVLWPCRQAIEADVLRVVNSHKRLARFGDDFEAVGIHRVSRGPVARTGYPTPRC
jgi:hypothetical protein